MGNLTYHQTIMEQIPQFVDEMTCLEEKRFEQINIVGLKDGVTITHMVCYVIPFIDKGEQCYITFGTNGRPTNRHLIRIRLPA